MRTPGATFRGIVLFEWRQAAARPAFAAAALAFAAFGALLSLHGPGSGGDLRNGPYAVAYSAGFLGLVSVFAATLLSAPSLLRDVEHRAAEIVWATPVSKRAYLLGRFAGSFLAVATCLAAGVAGLAAGGVLLSPDPAAAARLDPAAFLRAFLFLALPGALFAAAFLFAVAAATRSTAATYAAGVSLYILYWVLAFLAGSPILAGSGPWTAESVRLASLLDPFGLSAFLAETRLWTVAERNARPLPLGGALLGNRILVLGASALFLAASFRLFSFRLDVGSKREDEPPAGSPRDVAAWRPARVGAPGLLSLAASTARTELRALLRSRPLAALALLWLVALGIELAQGLRSAELGTARIATAGGLASKSLEPFGLFGALVLVFYGAEVASRERSARVSEVVDATPAPSAAFVLGKLAALAALLGALALSAAAVGTALQVATGSFAAEAGPWAGFFWFGLVPLLFLAVLVLAVHALVPSRGAGLLVSFAAILFLHRGALGGPDHLLLRYGAFPEARWSDFSGFGPAAASSAWFAAWWSAIAVLLGLLACGAWPRGTDVRLLPRLRALPSRLGPAGRRAAAVALAAAAATGAGIFARTNVVNRYETAESVATWKAGYERSYKVIEPLPQPSTTHLDATLNLEPGARRARMAGWLRLTNLAREPVPSVHLAFHRDVRVAALSLEGASSPTVDERFATRRFDLARPMPPGASLDLAFDLTLERRGPRADGEDDDLVADGSYLHGLALLPTVGYRPSRELTGEEERRRHGLPPRAAEAADDLDVPAEAGRMTFDVTVTTPADQLPVAPGVLVSSSVRDGRRVSRFRAERPVSAFFSVASARYAVARIHHAGVDVEVCHHPAHGRNAARVLEAATRALDYGVARYGPYPFPQLRIAEVPSSALGAGGFALPGVVYLSEDRAFLIDAEAPGRIDLLARRVAHEVSHQWWGHQLSPAPGPGAAALVETLARHTELRVLAAMRGPEALAESLDRERDRYIQGRTGGDEVPLVAVRDQAYLYYAKGALAMAALVDLAGEDAVDAALRGLLDAARASGRAPTARDLLDALLRVTPPEDRPLVEEWWTRTGLPEPQGSSR